MAVPRNWRWERQKPHAADAIRQRIEKYREGEIAHE